MPFGFNLDDIANKESLRYESLYERIEDGKRVLYAGEIKDIVMHDDSVRGRYVLSKFEISETGFSWGTPYTKGKKLVYTIDSGALPLFILQEHDGKIRMYDKELDLNKGLGGRSGIGKNAVKSKIKLTHEVIDTVFSPCEDKVLAEYQKRRMR